MIGVTGFWLVMMGLLVRLEIHPEATDILDVPVSFVLRTMFKHGQVSMLTVRDDTRDLGSISIRPSITGSDSRMMDFSGRLSVTPAQRVNFMGTVDLDETLRMRDFHMDLSTLDPPYRVRVSGDAALKSLSYEVRLENLPVAKQTLPMNAASIGTALAQNLGMDPRALPIAPSSIAAPAITARETELMLGGMQQEVYQVTVTENTAAVIDFYVTELGQIILAKTGFGYTLSSEEWQ